jgi:hypothetical protein
MVKNCRGACGIGQATADGAHIVFQANRITNVDDLAHLTQATQKGAEIHELANFASNNLITIRIMIFPVNAVRQS